MTPVAWQPADSVLQVLLLGRRPGSAPLLADALGRHGRFTVQACTTPADAAVRLGSEPWDCVVVNLADDPGDEGAGAEAAAAGDEDAGAETAALRGPAGNGVAGDDPTADLAAAVTSIHHTGTAVPVIALGDLGPAGAAAALPPRAGGHLARLGAGGVRA